MSDPDVDLAELLQLALDSRQRTIHTAMPGRVVSYDASEQTASIDLLVELAIPKRSGGHGYEKLPTLHGVPVGHPRGGGFVVHFPLERDDHVWVMFAERSMDEVVRNGSRSRPRDLRMHDLSFAYAIPASSPAKRDALESTPTPNALVIGVDGGNQVVITPTGVALGSATGTQMMIQGTAHVAALTSLLTALGPVISGLIPAAGPTAPQIAAAAAALTAFGTHLSSGALSTKHRIDG